MTILLESATQTDPDQPWEEEPLIPSAWHSVSLRECVPETPRALAQALRDIRSLSNGLRQAEAMVRARLVRYDDLCNTTATTSEPARKRSR